MSEEQRSLDPNSVEAYEDSYNFQENVLKKIAGRVAWETSGILDVQSSLFSRLAGSVSDELSQQGDGIQAFIEEDKVSIALKITMAYGARAEEIFAELRKRIADDIERMTGLELAELRVEIVDILTKDEFKLMMAEHSQAAEKT